MANAKLAYAPFRRMAGNERWNALEAAGARPQRLLWASTGNKNPAYSDVGYVEPLIGAHTVNTMPAATAAAFADQGEPGKNLTRAVPVARKVLKDLKLLGSKPPGRLPAVDPARGAARVIPSVDLRAVMAYRQSRNWRFWPALDFRRFPFGIFHD